MPYAHGGELVLYNAERAREQQDKYQHGVVVEEVDDDGEVVLRQVAAELPTVPDTSAGEAVPEYFQRPGSPRIEVVGTTPPHEWSAVDGGVYVEELESNEQGAGADDAAAVGYGTAPSGGDWLSAAMSGGAPAAVGTVADGYDSDVDMMA